MIHLVRSKPVLSVIEGDNDDLMVAVARLWIRPSDKVLDTTYGKGAFWSKRRPRHLIISDYDFTALPYEDGEMDVVVYDPPYTSNGGDATDEGVAEMRERYGTNDIKGWQNLFARNNQGLKECARVSRRLLMVKCADFVESGAKRWGHQGMLDTAKGIGLKRVDEFVLVSGPGPQPKKNLDGTPRRQVHSRRAHSFLCVFTLPAGDPGSPRSSPRSGPQPTDTP
jgi:hypothetical protein